MNTMKNGKFIGFGCLLCLLLNSCSSEEKKAQNEIKEYLEDNKIELFMSPNSLKILKYSNLREDFDTIPTNEDYIRYDSLRMVYENLKDEFRTNKNNPYKDSVKHYKKLLEETDPEMSEESLGYSMDVYFTTKNEYNADIKQKWTFEFLEVDELWGYVDEDNNFTKIYTNNIE